MTDRRKGTIALIALCLTTTGQLVGGIWWAATLTSKVEHLSTQVGTLQATTYSRVEAQGERRAMEIMMHDLSRRMGVVEERTTK